MVATCPACGTDNRDSAMFCRGCLAKLPAFAPTAPSVLESLRIAAGDAAVNRRRAPMRLTAAQAMAAWLCFGVLLLVGVLALVVWSATSARVPRLRATPPVPLVQAAAPPARQHASEQVEVLTAAHVPVTKPETSLVDEPEAMPERAAPQPGGRGAASKARSERAFPVANAKPRKDRRLTPVAVSMSGARAACDRYNPYGEVLCTQGGYPYRTWRSGRR